MTKITDLGVVETLNGLNKKDFSSEEVVSEYLKLIEKDTKLNAYIHFNRDKSLSEAKKSDQRRANNSSLPLEGLPIAIKDIFCVEGEKTSACSKMLENFVPDYESTVTSKLWQSGGIYIGKTSMDEFAMGSSNETSYFGEVTNPWSTDGNPLVPGGSSGGSASAVAARMAPVALGTDTGGSIRQPASFCGTVGIKPTYGRCSRWGVIAFASSLDQAGPITRSVKDSAVILQNMAGFDAMDSTSADINVPNFVNACSKSIKGMKIGIPKEYRLDNLSNDVQNVWESGIKWLKDAGAEVIDVTLPHTKYALPTYYIVAPAEASANLSRYDGVKYGHRCEDIIDLEDMYSQTRAEGFGEEVKRRILIGTYVLSAGYYDAYYLRAQKVRTKIVEDFNLAFNKCDAILTPTAPTGAFKIGEKNIDPVTMYMNDVFTVPSSLAGLPAMSIPSGLDAQGCPLGLQLIGKGFDEETIFSIGSIIEEAANFKYI
ncbi:Asp-tRNA(Asn)/Glu-tRNA(Gln) amidotransferase subunit GatA [Alphaproteobacteria bacterium]|nr:Asp-tRNA(Asn)/Glu-tRNA(Gln) amidotransferase subunit GatA [Alphaproteobacteria bacterium]